MNLVVKEKVNFEHNLEGTVFFWVRVFQTVRTVSTEVLRCGLCTLARKPE